MKSVVTIKLKISQKREVLETMEKYSKVKVIKNNAYKTSKTCSRCGKEGVRFKSFFVCFHCGYSLNADLNASRNLAKHHSMSDDVSADVKQPYIPNDDSKTISNTNGIADEFRDNNTKILGVMPP